MAAFAAAGMQEGAPKRSKLVAVRRYSSLQDPESLRELVLRMHEGLYVTSREGEIIDANPAFLDMLGVASLV